MYKVWWFAELLPDYKILEEKMLDIIKKNYRQFGYTPIETPAVEKTEVLTAKWWWEVKNQIFWVYWLAQGAEDLKDYSLHFDLTVPFSRYVLDYRWELAFPFKRSQIWKVWRWERQQRWRSKEFYQADIDVIWEENTWKDYLFYDAEVVSVAFNTYAEIFREFNIEAKIKLNINNRKIIVWFIASLWLSDKLTDISIIIDKIDKISVEKFLLDLTEVTKDSKISEKILAFCRYDATIENLENIKNELSINNEEFDKWIYELKEVLNYIYLLGLPKDKVIINLSIIRGLAYYTWTVFETFIDWDRTLGSIGSGWRYEKLTSYIDSSTSYSWVWFSIWVTRIEEFLFEKIDKNMLQKTTSDYLIINFAETLKESLNLYNTLTSSWKNAEFYPEPDKLQKQFKYADKKGIKYCLILWETELKNWAYVIKDMNSGESREIKI